jgi:hypothetical protein
MARIQVSFFFSCTNFYLCPDSKDENSAMEPSTRPPSTREPSVIEINDEDSDGQQSIDETPEEDLSMFFPFFSILLVTYYPLVLQNA